MKATFTIALVFAAIYTFGQNSPVLNISKAFGSHAKHKMITRKDTVIESYTTKENKEPRYVRNLYI
jgi:hypothetical protein